MALPRVHFLFSLTLLATMLALVPVPHVQSLADFMLVNYIHGSVELLHVHLQPLHATLLSAGIGSYLDSIFIALIYYVLEPFIFKIIFQQSACKDTHMSKYSGTSASKHL